MKMSSRTLHGKQLRPVGESQREEFTVLVPSLGTAEVGTLV